MKNIVVIGGGNMGFTYAEGIYNAKIANIEIVEKYEERAEQINAMGKMKASIGYASIAKADIIFLAVKPQIAPEVFEEIKGLVNPNQLFVSVMAGMKIETIQKGLNVPKVIRCMPNLPASIQLGMTTYVPSPTVTEAELKITHEILAATGKAFLVKEEEAIDFTTGISGSGSAYVFYFMNAMVQAAEKLGFSKEESKILVSQTFEGAVALYQQNDISLEEWMSRVTSKGGTTFEALKSFDNDDVNKHIQNGVKACVNRAVELGNS